ncbi:MAG: DUF4956 domain-containing protein [Candidatus Stahlbacteria bacterium]|nr:DUF4956 domain-containing protein [Candidatus Stahlbacteria bacterium]
MFEQLQNLNLFPALSGLEIILNIVIAFICGYLISWVYRRTYRGPGYSITFVNGIVLLSMITAVVIMVIGNNLARAFGLVGAMSIIRFRTAVKSVQDIIYLFFALAMGMAAGVGLYGIAFTGTFFIGLVIYAFSKSTLSIPNREEYLLQFNFLSPQEPPMEPPPERGNRDNRDFRSAPTSDDKNPPYQVVLDKHCEKQQIINVKSINEAGLLELSYYVKLKDINKSQAFVNELRKISGVQYANLFFDEEHF